MGVVLMISVLLITSLCMYPVACALNKHHQQQGKQKTPSLVYILVTLTVGAAVFGGIDRLRQRQSAPAVQHASFTIEQMMSHIDHGPAPF